MRVQVDNELEIEERNSRGAHVTSKKDFAIARVRRQIGNPFFFTFWTFRINKT